MSLGLVGRKVGMMRIFNEDGSSVPVTVLDCAGNRIIQIRTPDTDGYCAIQVAYGKRRASRVSKALAGHYAKAGVEAGSILKEFRVSAEVLADLKVGGELKADMFQVGQKVDVTGVTIGKGFQGAIRRHHFSSNRASHGNSRSHNSAGSIGAAPEPGRVLPGKKMAGHLGDNQRTIQLLEVARVDVERGLLMIKGSVPGAKNGSITVHPSVKAKAVKGGAK
jgi:large subunit ribosomal protein L3